MLRCVSVSLLITVLSLCSGCRSGKESSDAGEVDGDHIAVDKVGIAAIYEEMAKADAGFFTTMSVANLALKPLVIGGAPTARGARLRLNRAAW